MSEEDLTLGQVVIQVIETLSDAISQLVLFVVVREEENSPVPPELPPAANVVGNAAQALVNVARNLAEVEYSTYPDIKNEILEAAQQVETATNDLIKTVNALCSSSNRKQAWAGLSDACKIIAGKTVHLLQIVYGAELQRLFALGSELESALDKLDPLQAGENPQAFADTAGDVASKAAQLAQYLLDKAKDEESPFLKKLLEDCGEELRRQGEELIDLANKLLQDPGNQDLQRQLAEKINQIKDTTKRALDALKDLEDERGQQTLDFKTPADLPDEVRRYRDAKRAREEAERNGHVLEALNDPSDPRASVLPLEDEKVLAKISKANDKLDDIEDALKRKNQPDLNRALQDLDDLLRDLNQDAKNLANHKDGPAKKAIVDALEAVNKLLPQQKTLAKTYENSPSEEHAKALEKAHDHLQNALDNLTFAVSPPTAVVDGAHRGDKLTDAVQHAALNKDTDGLKAAAHSQNRAIDSLADQSNKLAQGSSPEKQKEILGALDSVKKLVPVQLAAAKKALDAPSAKTEKDLEQQTKNLQDALDHLSKAALPPRATGIVDKSDELEKLLSDLHDAATKGDTKKVDQVSKQLTGVGKDLCELLRAEAGNNQNPPAVRNELIEAINDLENLLPTLTKEAALAGKNPRDPNAREKLEDLLKNFENQLGDLLIKTNAPVTDAAADELSALEKLASAVRDQDGPKSTEAAKQLIDAHNHLKPTVEQQAANLRDAEKRKNLLQDLDDLEKLLPDLLATSQKALAKPTDQSASEFENLVNGVKNKITDITQDSKPYTETLVDHVRAVPKLDHPKESALRELESRAPRVLELAEELKSAPNNPDAKKNFDQLLDSLLKPLENMLSGLDDKQKTSAAKDQVEADFHRLEDAIDHRDPAQINKALADLEADMKSFQDRAKSAANSHPDPANKKSINDALDELAKLFPHVNSSAKQLAQNPFDLGAKDQFRTARDDIKSNLDIIENKVNPSDLGAQIQKNIENQLAELDNLKKAAQNKDAKGIDNSLDKLGKLNNELQDLVRNKAAQITDPKKKKDLLAGIDDLEDLLNDLGKSGKRLGKNPNDPDALKRLNDQLDNFAKSLKTLPPKVNPPGASDAKKALDQLDELVGATRRGDAKDVTEKAKELAQTARQLSTVAKEEAAKESNPQKKKELTDNADDVLKGLAGVIDSAKKALQDKSNPNRDIAKAARNFQAPVRNILAQLDPTKENEIEAARTNLKRAADRVVDDAHKGNNVDPGLAEFQKVFNRIQKKNIEAQNSLPPSHRTEIDEALKKVEELKPKFEKQAKVAQANPNNEREQKKLDDLNQQLQDLLDRVNELTAEGTGGDAEQLSKAKAKAQALIAALKAPGAKFDPKNLINAAKILASQLSNLINLAKLEAIEKNGAPLSEKARMALELDRMLTEIETAASERARGLTNTDVNKLLNDLQDLSSKTGSAKPTIKHKPAPNTFEGAVAQVVESVQKVLLQTKSAAPQLDKDATIVGTTNIASQLEQLAEAARTGDKQGLLVIGRSIAACIVAMSAELKDVSARCKDKRLQDKLVRTNQALRNYSTQLKILAAVKAAGGTKDSDEQLITLTRSLGGALQDAVTTVKIIKTTKRV